MLEKLIHKWNNLKKKKKEQASYLVIDASEILKRKFIMIYKTP